jgi:NADH-quinone oxidoreductase subunit C
MNNIEKVKEIVNKTSKVKKFEQIDKFQIAFEVEKNDIHQTLSALKLAGWKQLSYLSAVDWIEEGKFELVYLVFNWDEALYVQVRAMIERENPEMNSIISVFPGAKYYEREAHEFFGIKFPGNPDYHKQLILENWDDIPPLRKDFDPSVYSDRKFPKREYPTDYSVKDPENKSFEKIKEREKRAESLRTGGQKK